MQRLRVEVHAAAEYEDMAKTKATTWSEEIQLRLAVNGDKWKRVESFKDSSPEDPHYDMRIDQDGNAVIRFGDGKMGRSPETGSEITATYRYGLGKSGRRRKKRSRICFSLE